MAPTDHYAAYALAAEYAETFAGATVNHPTRNTVDIAQLLDQGGGVIVVATNDHALVGALDAVPVLERLPAVPDGAAKTALTVYDAVALPELRETARDRGLRVASNASRATVVALLVAFDHGDLRTDDAPPAAAGDPDADPPGGGDGETTETED